MPPVKVWPTAWRRMFMPAGAAKPEAAARRTEARVMKETMFADPADEGIEEESVKERRREEKKGVL